MLPRVSGRIVSILFAGAVIALLLAGPAAADHPPPVQQVPGLQIDQAPEPPLTATPQAKCGPGSRSETGLQGRVPAEDHASGRAAQGYTCNAELVGSYTDPTAQ